MKNIEREVFSLPNMEVVKASYKNSVYYIAGSNDITEYVKIIKATQDMDDLDAITYGLDLYLRDHPENSQLAVPLFDVVLLNDSSTSFDYVIHIVNDLFRKDVNEAYDIANLIHTNGFCEVGTYPYELAHTFACMVETANMQTKQQLQTDIVPSHVDPLAVIEQLIRRDHPDDI
ncbi:putative ATP-dependent Clp protease adapter protein [Erwinia phage pEa_SNUABM_50]|uniref:ATP-dependent Clp protease n=4 Tax=Eneladusvirus BF TaxID=2560751 RepID=A0A1S6UAW1_9CAUD|nr:ATP-dependent protease [Serratia phage BF]QOI71254.1 putative ATP-dependent Clp protease adapter protein [Erwinia phage pEa_SNUABM_12]QOI71798.1 putative ATP-dependent Clp protease adapter protein [Erwinia phage pEa_SNUABM_47]QOI72337.1 putative ATP-dependent Clp protease adapter protein [Erwinia phage pEa_SNUABM_50]QXO11463.1 hypothetical protein pEaSNUABM19_00317 [Erwinia phage pEa_SNUABM_19]QXO12011.1 hypothetical protein pEaSNUABM44_00315 [Erwinia phage pEa_SNUABM_44]QXO12564.1 hypothe